MRDLYRVHSIQSLVSGVRGSDLSDRRNWRPATWAWGVSRNERRVDQTSLPGQSVPFGKFKLCVVRGHEKLLCQGRMWQVPVPKISHFEVRYSFEAPVFFW